MKIKVSVSMEDKTMRKVESLIQDNSFRNKSHFIELAVQKLIQEVDNGQNH